MSQQKIICGDALLVMKSMPSDSVEAIVTDPPYCSAAPSERMRPALAKYNNWKGSREHYADNFAGETMDVRSWRCWTADWVREALRVLKPSGYFLMFTDWRKLPDATDAIQIGGVLWRGIVAWDKGNSARAPHKGYFRHQCEYVLWGTKGKCLRRTDAGSFPGCISCRRDINEKYHVAGKPVKLMEQLLQVVPVSGTVLDPFAGSGSTLVAAKNIGRNAIGIECMQEYCDIAKRRIDGARNGAFV